MSSLPKQQHTPIPPSSSSKQSAFRANSSSSTTAPAASRPRPIGQRQDTEHNQLGDNGPPILRADDAAPEGQVEVDAEAAAAAAEATPNFKPLFTLVEDSNSSDYHHPTVHYIFSDDDTDLITEASLRVLETGQVSPPAQNTQHGGSTSYNDEASEMRNQQSSSSNLEMDNRRRPSVLPEPIPGVKERFILLDVEPTATLGGGGGGPSSAPPDAALTGTSAGTTNTIMSTSPAQRQQLVQPPAAAGGAAGATPFGYRIASAHSLTSDWQVLGASFSPAPTFDTPQQQQEATNSDQANTLMLRIEGTAGFPLPSAGKDAREQQPTLEEMMDQFDKRMAELRQVIETNGDYSPPPAEAAAAAAEATGLDENHDDDDTFDNDNNDDDNDQDRGDADYNSSSSPARVQQRGETRGEEGDQVVAAAAAPGPEE